MKIKMDVPVSGAVIDEKDKLAIIETVTNGWFTEGEKCKEFVRKIRSFIGINHASLVNSGSSANLLAIAAIKDFYTIDQDQNKVVTCATGFPTTIASIVQAGLVPLFIDVNPKTLNPDTNTMLGALARPDVVGIIQAHTLGFPYDAKAIREFCDANGKFFIEDCCDALGAEIYGKKVGTFGHASTLSFFPAHHIMAIEGGAVLTNDGRLFSLVNTYRDWGRACYCLPGQSNTCNKRFSWKWTNLPEGYDHKYTFTKFGYNMKSDELRAAMGLSQMDKIDQFVNKRISNSGYLGSYLNFKYSNMLFIAIDRFDDNSPEYYSDFGYYHDLKNNINASPFGLPITVFTNDFTRKELIDHLEANGVHTRPVFAGNITRQPMFDNVKYEVFGDLSGSDYVMERTFWIGVHPALTQQQLDYVVEVFDGFFKMRGLK